MGDSVVVLFSNGLNSGILLNLKIKKKNNVIVCNMILLSSNTSTEIQRIEFEILIFN